MREIADQFNNYASKEGQSTAKLPKTAAVLSSVLEFDGMTREDAVNYAEALGQTITTLRAQNIPIVWACINSKLGNQAFIPAEGAEPKQISSGALRHMGVIEDAEVYDNYDVLERFISDYGPRQNEAVFRKAFMSAFLEPDDIEHENKADHQAELLRQAGIIVEGYPQGENPEMFSQVDTENADNAFLKLFNDDITLAEYFREQKYERTLVMGQVAYYCNLETAIDASVKGFHPTIVGDRCLGWSYTKDTVADKEIATCIWKSDVDVRGNPLTEKISVEQRMQKRLDEITMDETALRGITSEQAIAIRNIPIVRFENLVEISQVAFPKTENKRSLHDKLLPFPA